MSHLYVEFKPFFQLNVVVFVDWEWLSLLRRILIIGEMKVKSIKLSCLLINLTVLSFFIVLLTNTFVYSLGYMWLLLHVGPSSSVAFLPLFFPC